MTKGRASLSATVDEIIGYVQPWIISPGDTAEVKISSTRPSLQYRLVRLLQGLKVHNAPPVKKEVIEEGPKGQCSGRFQTAFPGSFGEVARWPQEMRLHPLEGIHVSLFFEPWKLDHEYIQTLVSNLDVKSATGFSLSIDIEQKLLILIGTGTRVESLTVPFSPRCQRWCSLDLQIDRQRVDLTIKHLPYHLEPAPDPAELRATLSEAANLNSPRTLLFAAEHDEITPSGAVHPKHFFNGRLDSPCLRSLGSRPRDLAIYDFSIGISTDEIIDTSGSGLNGRLVHAPTRAVRGHDYDHNLIGKSWEAATYGYGAIHFHEDDLDDADWETDFSFAVPSGLRSGAYAIEVEDTEGSVSDSIVFFVRPSALRSHARTAFVFSTFTYLAYANEHMYDDSKPTHISFPEGVQLLKSVNYERMVRRSDLGLSIYDIHSDGSGNVFSTSKRPILNLRPDYVHWGFERPREFSADLLMVGFLEEKLGDGYDILTDHDLDLYGPSVLASYDVVISGSHPEYPSLRSLDAYEGFAKLGGSIMYLGGNGFYWRSLIDRKRPWRMEVRRADVGARTHELPYGDRWHALECVQGGLWRSIGRSPNELFGIGSCASGKGPGRPFHPSTTSTTNPQFSWIWEGIDTKAMLGKAGLAGGASGDELDRVDYGIGSPLNTVLVARSERHDDHFMLFNEELIFPMIGTLGSTSEMVRSDIVYYDTNRNGAVFSVGSINWNNSLAWNNYSNDIAQMTKNVLRKVLSRAEEARTRK
ncbi:hypothetical protein P170DRAFT_504534 [Aspergillus steynii IBT 23096]|uniref:N,N-dimethylformamidase beta subunit-like C-terminal domain-containing protein n=1 Tax=Aspergillus steynii IBT 23096 TaxID=1392250 RepID=A0A2I2GL36_9EURO|nr:uncharacterized protein P170DRAFT_504534 [Aspergillus steynii IBT 23096]PLB53588.1 hypothetical protein P170DRAFT_504534 [Aspergillus steynii IBT 23096]